MALVSIIVAIAKACDMVVIIMVVISQISSDIAYMPIQFRVISDGSIEVNLTGYIFFIHFLAMLDHAMFTSCGSLWSFSLGQ